MTRLTAVSVLACAAFGGCSSEPLTPTILVTNRTGVPLKIVAYDYSAPTMPPGAPPGIYVSPEYTIGVLGDVASDSACLAFVGLRVGDKFALAGEDTVTGVDTPASGTFVPDDAAGWTATFDSLHESPVGPLATSSPCPLR